MLYSNDVLPNICLTHLPLIYAFVNWISIGSGNGLSPIRHQAITWTHAHLLSIEPLGTNFSEIRMKNTKLFVPENAFENVVCEMASILTRERWAKANFGLTVYIIMIARHHEGAMGCTLGKSCDEK